MVNIAEEGIDIALRFGAPADENHIVRKLASMELRPALRPCTGASTACLLP
jgi:DNA-binding transcriptional LysR family regulator